MSNLSMQGGATGTGTVTLLAPVTSTDRTLTLPDATDTVAGIAATQTLTNKTLSTGLVMAASAVSSGTAQASSGTSIDFTGIPTWVKRITVMFNGFSTSGGGNYLVQIGAGSITSSGYLSNGGYIQGTSPNGSQSSTAGYVVTNSSNTALTHGQFVLTTLGSNIWTASYSMSQTTSQFVMFGAGTITLGGTLDRVRITSAVGSDTLDAGTLNILYE